MMIGVVSWWFLLLLHDNLPSQPSIDMQHHPTRLQQDRAPGGYKANEGFQVRRNKVVFMLSVNLLGDSRSSTKYTTTSCLFIIISSWWFINNPFDHERRSCRLSGHHMQTMIDVVYLHGYNSPSGSGKYKELNAGSWMLTRLLFFRSTTTYLAPFVHHRISNQSVALFGWLSWSLHWWLMLD